MWGTIARMQLKPDVPEAYLVAQLKAFSTDRMSGFVDATLYRSSGDPLELWMVAMFEDEEAYLENAERPAQHSIFLTLSACLERDLEWHDVAQVMTLGAAQED
jgi:quinol monooxygenase YgiN